jgi:hypothetical protein
MYVCMYVCACVWLCSVALHPSGLQLVVTFHSCVRLMSILMDDIRAIKDLSIKVSYVYLACVRAHVRVHVRCAHVVHVRVCVAVCERTLRWSEICAHAAAV